MKQQQQYKCKSSTASLQTTTTIDIKPHLKDKAMKSSYALGLFYIFLVSIIWSAASILVQYLYEGLDFDSPFLLTYIGTSLFIILIPSYLIYQRRRKIHRCLSDVFFIICWWWCCCCCGEQSQRPSYDEGSDDGCLEQPQTSTEGTPLATNVGEDLEDDFYINEHNSDEQDTNENDSQSNMVDTTSEYFLSHLDHLGKAAKIAPWWFLSNYFYNLSLKYTTIT